VDSTVSRKPRVAAGLVFAAFAIFIASVPSAHGASGYVRPKGASPTRIPMVPIFERCDWEGGGRRSDTVHGGGLRNSAGNPLRACTNPEQVSGTLTIGTPDANGKQANSVGTLAYTTIVGNPATPQNEADVRIDFDLTDVRLQGSLADYPGELQLNLDSRITDRNNGPAHDEPATTQEFFYTAPIPCTPTASASIGSTCSLHTTVNTLVPNTIVEGKRTIWEQADHTHIYDGGPDWKASTENDNLVFMTYGLYVP
jgi:hypothetical protein